MNKYVCFYTDRSFWAKEKPGFDYLINNRESFNNEFSEQIYKYYNNIFYFGVCRDGLIVTRINKLESDRDEMLSPENTSPYSFDQFISRYLIYENAIQLLFCSSYFKKTGWDLGFVSLHSGDTLTFIEDNGKLICDMFPQNSKYTKYYTDRFSNGVVINPFEIPHYFSCSDVALDENTFNLCVDDLSKIIDDYEKVLILSHVSHAVHELKIMNFRQSLIQSWFVIEYFINIKCELYLKSDTIRGLEKKLLINRRTSVEYKILVLKDNALIDDLVFTKIDILRRRRNDMVHNIMCSNIDTTSDLDILGLCSSSFEVIKYFIQSEYNLDLGINCGYSLYCL